MRMLEVLRDGWEGSVGKGIVDVKASGSIREGGYIAVVIVTTASH